MMNKTGNWWWPIPKERLFVLTFLFCESSFIVRLKRVFFLKIFALFVSNFMKRHYSFLHFCFVSFVGLLVGVSFNQIKKQNKKKKQNYMSFNLALFIVCVCYLITVTIRILKSDICSIQWFECFFYSNSIIGLYTYNVTI